LMFDNYIRGLTSFKKILNYCDTAEFFQDVPFSFPGFWKEVYKKYPDAYYILTVRDSSEKWFGSLFKFHSQVYGDGKTLSEANLKNSYNGTGMAWRFINYVYPNIELYNENEYKKIYEKHNKEIVEFFIGKDNFLKINI